MSIREIILDTETTGLDPLNGHRIIEIGAIEMINKVVTKNIFHTYLNPQRDMPNEAYQIHGISGEFLKDKPLFKDIVDDFINFVGKSRLVIHNAQFDIKFINHELTIANIPSLDLSSTVDTLRMAKTKYPGFRVNLDALCRMFGIDNSDRKFHGALKDAYLLAEVYVELTGGRQNSFNLQETRNVSNNNLVKEEKINKRRTKIIKPSETELEEHQQFMIEILAN